MGRQDDMMENLRRAIFQVYSNSIIVLARQIPDWRLQEKMVWWKSLHDSIDIGFRPMSQGQPLGLRSKYRQKTVVPTAILLASLAT